MKELEEQAKEIDDLFSTLLEKSRTRISRSLVVLLEFRSGIAASVHDANF